jgi:DNA topoisomerase-2
LIINFIHHFWPSLIKLNIFLSEFVTPLIKVTKSQNSSTFYAIQDYKNWNENTADSHLWKIKYYKGLGTSTDKEAKEYF